MWPFTSAKKKALPTQTETTSKQFHGSCSGCGLKAEGNTWDEFCDDCEQKGIEALTNSGKPIGFICQTCIEFLNMGEK